jgi:hypothetical protein
MKSLRILTLLLTLPLLSVPATSFAAKGNKAGKGSGKALRTYDANADGKIEGPEIEAVRTAFEADKEGALKALDKDADGKLSDAEITGAKMKAKGAGKKKKNA